MSEVVAGLVTDFGAMRALLGSRVTAWMSFEPGAYSPSVTGKLTELDEYGGFAVRDDDGVVHYCWPALGMQDASA